MAKQALRTGLQNQAMNNPVFVVAVAALIALISTDLSQIVFVFAGAVAFAFLQMHLPTPPPKLSKAKRSEEDSVASGGRSPQERTQRGRFQAKPAPASSAPRQPETWHPSIQPVTNMSFQNSTFDAAVNELVGRIAPSPSTARTLDLLLAAIRKEIKTVLPGAEVVGCVGASLDLGSGTAFGVAVPEVEVVVVASPALIAQQIPIGPSGQHDQHKLTKAAIRTCADKLVASGFFKFRRSAFRSDEPKVNLLAVSSLGIHEESVPISFAVNAISPLFSCALMAELGRMSPAGLELALVVRRWAKHRAICHSAKGHLSPYYWTLLVIYFLQVRGVEGVPLLPSLSEWKLPSSLEACAKRCEEEGGCVQHSDAVSGCAAALFKGFLKFYAKEFDAHSEAVSVRLGRRAPPHTSLPLHAMADASTGAAEIGWSIEDPLDRRHNLGDVSNVWSLGRLREELARAHSLCALPDTALAELLEPWVPTTTDEVTRT